MSNLEAIYLFYQYHVTLSLISILSPFEARKNLHPNLFPPR